MPELKKTVKTDPRPVVYPRVEAYVLEGVNAITFELSKRYLGWEEEPEDGSVKFKDKFLFAIPKGCEGEGRKVRCHYNTRNRQLIMSWVETLGQDQLNRNWADSRNGGEAVYTLADGVEWDGELGKDRTLTLPEETMNGETIIIGRHGQVLSGQHRLIALVLAYLRWKREVAGGHWHGIWGTAEPTIEGLVVVGVAEGSRTTRTIDNVKPRTLADVLFCEAGTFGDRKLTPGNRAKLCRMTEFCVKNMWDRTGAKDDPFSSHRTHSEALEFIDRHPRILKVVRHIFEEDKNGQLSAAVLKVGEGEDAKTFPNPVQVSPGYAAAAMYLMGSSTSDGDKYRDGPQSGGPPSERQLKWDSWEKAEEFWTMVAGRSPTFKGLFAALQQFVDPDTGLNRITKLEKEAIYVKAWRAFAAGKPVTEKACRLALEEDYVEGESGVRELKERPTWGGADLGGGGKVRSEKPGEGAVEDKGPDPTPEEIEAKKAEMEKERAAEEEKRKAAKKKADTATGPKTKTEKATTPAADTKSAKGSANGKAPKQKKLTPAEALRAKQQADAAAADEKLAAEAKANAAKLEQEVQDEAAAEDGEDDLTLEEETAAQAD